MVAGLALQRPWLVKLMLSDFRRTPLDSKVTSGACLQESVDANRKLIAL